MLPLRDNNPTRTFPWMTILLIVTNVLVYIKQVQVGPAFDATYSLIPREVTTGQDMAGVVTMSAHGVTYFQPELMPTALAANQILLLPPPHPQWLTIFTAMFMHAGLLHIGGNMLVLWIFGNNVEDALGKVRFLAFYVVCGLAAAIAQIAIAPNSLIPTLGASGAIAGVMAAYLVLFPGARVLSLIFLGFIGFVREISAFWVIGIWILLQIIPGINSLNSPAQGGVAYFAHIGGFAMGLLLTLLLGGRKLEVSQRRKPRYNVR
jgi:membrane associated rhomboid family serine protease